MTRAGPVVVTRAAVVAQDPPLDHMFQVADLLLMIHTYGPSNEPLVVFRVRRVLFRLPRHHHQQTNTSLPARPSRASFSPIVPAVRVAAAGGHNLYAYPDPPGGGHRPVMHDAATRHHPHPRHNSPAVGGSGTPPPGPRLSQKPKLPRAVGYR